MSTRAQGVGGPRCNLIVTNRVTVVIALKEGCFMRLKKTECHKGLNLKLVARNHINSNPNSRFATNMEENYPFTTLQVFHIFLF